MSFNAEDWGEKQRESSGHENAAEMGQAQRHWRLMVDATPSALMLVDSQFNIVLVNAAAERLFGYSRNELVGHKLDLLIPLAIRESHLQMAKEFVKCPRTRLMGDGQELCGLRKDGVEVPLEIGLNHISENGEIYVLASILDVSKRKKAEENLQINQERLALVIRGSNDGIWDWDLKTDNVYFSPRWKSMLGYADDEVKNVFSSWIALLHPADRHRAFSVVRQYLDGRSDFYELEHRLRHKDGSYRWILARGVVLRDAQGKPVRMAGSHVDLTERKEAEEHLRQANAELGKSRKALEVALEELKFSHENLKTTQYQLIRAAKLESVGMLAAGVAHEVKNPLQVLILGLSYLQKVCPKEDPAVHQLMLDMEAATKRADAVVRELLNFSKGNKFELQEHDLNEVIERTLRFVTYEVNNAGVTVRREFSGERLMAQMDEEKIQQIFVNLFMNAIQAMGKGGTLIVRTRGAIAEPEAENGNWLSTRFEPGAKLILAEVEDTGPGIRPEHLPKIFEPFFTTKPIGQGTGLGLSVVKRIVDLHRGAIRVRNVDGGGACFTLALARVDQGA